MVMTHYEWLFVCNTEYPVISWVFSLLLFQFQCIERRLAMTVATYLEMIEKHCPEPSLRVIANRLLTDDDIQFMFDTIESVSSELLSSIWLQLQCLIMFILDFYWYRELILHRHCFRIVPNNVYWYKFDHD